MNAEYHLLIHRSIRSSNRLDSVNYVCHSLIRHVLHQTIFYSWAQTFTRVLAEGLILHLKSSLKFWRNKRIKSVLNTLHTLMLFYWVVYFTSTCGLIISCSLCSHPRTHLMVFTRHSLVLKGCHSPDTQVIKHLFGSKCYSNCCYFTYSKHHPRDLEQT